ncbi:MAG: PEP-CTERM sorting domain-containing protein [Alphaproteobacteria bacterium]|nr:MAG: PEP-CTERM sorting domain-containing protein [Alphaproteobacteria bacterium]
MKTSARVTVSTLAAVALGLAATSPVHAIPVIANGGFEAGLTSWTKSDQLGSEGTFLNQSGTSSPVNLDPVPPPPEGTMAAMTDAQGPGSHVLYQDFVATADAAALRFALFIGNRANDFFTPTPASLDFSTPALNQQARVDILKNTADPFSVAATDVLLNLYQTKAGDPLISGYNTITTDISALLAAHVGETLRLRFAETDNVFAFQLGVDAVRIDPITAPIPEPASMLLLGAALAVLAGCRVGARSRRALA